MNLDRLNELLARLPGISIAVVGDFFLDKYMVTDPALSEVSIETGLEARQVVQVRCSPGAAGTVTNNVSALGVGRIEAVGVIGSDGEGFELARGLRRTRVGCRRLRRSPSRFTPTYTKPMRLTPGGEVEMERLDIKNRRALPAADVGRIVAALRALTDPGSPERVDGIIVADQVEERNCGVVTDAVREALAEIGRAHPEITILADSRVRIGEFEGVTVKPNHLEAARACGDAPGEVADLNAAMAHGRALAARAGRPVFLTLGKLGILACTADRADHAPAPPVRGPIDIVGAGDSVAAGIVAALCAGADPLEAARFGNLCASVTIHKLGTTGTASPDELRRALAG
jgi:rfaE bifunctional protein kinase chain/domain